MKASARLVGAGLLGATIFLYGATSEVAWLLLLAYFIWALTLAAYGYAHWNAAGLSSEVRVLSCRPGPNSPAGELPERLLQSGPAPAPLFEGDCIHFGLSLRSGRGERGPARLSGRISGQDFSVAGGVIPPAGWESTRELSVARRGPLLAEGWQLESSDPLGIFKQVRPGAGAELGLVLPVFASLAAAARQQESEASLPAVLAGSGNELFGARDYLPGDSLRRIHWPASARHARLVVREFEPPGRHGLVIVLDADPPDRETADQAARIAASEVWDCLQAGGRAQLWAPGLEPTAVSAGGDLWALLEWLGRYPDLPADDRPPPLRGELVVIATRPESAALGQLQPAGRHRGQTRVWAVGAFAIETHHPLRQVGLGWPL